MDKTLWRKSSAVPGQPHLVWLALKATTGIRVTVTEEGDELDVGEHGIELSQLI